MPMMNIFEPLFLLLALTAIVTLAVAAVRALRGELTRAGRIVRRVGIGAAVYFALAIVVSIVSPRPAYGVGDTQCFDDWCITVIDARPAGTPPELFYEVSLRLSSRAKRVPMGEKGTVVYLTDARGRRYDPLPGAEVPLDTILQPGESVVARRRFPVAGAAMPLGLVYTREGGFPIGWLIVGEGGWFSKPPIVRLN